MNTESATATEKKRSELFERIGDSLYRRGGVIFARVRVNGKRTFRSTNTNNPTEARQWLRKFQTERFLMRSGIEPQGVVLHRGRVTVARLIDDYIGEGCPKKTMAEKAPATVEREKRFLGICRAFFGGMLAAAVTMADCDKYRKWRKAGGYVSPETGKQTKSKRKWKRDRTIDMELGVLSNVFRLAERRAVLKTNPLAGRGRYSEASEIRHCREVAPTPEGLHTIEKWLRERGENEVADLACFLGYSGLRIGEALALDWECVDWAEKLLHVKREKRGIMPWVPMTADLAALLQQMKARARSHLLFPSPFDAETPRVRSAFSHRLTAACKEKKIGHVTAHGLRSYFVTQCRQSGLTDGEVAMLIGDKTGPAIIASTYGDLRPDHLLAQARRIRFKASGNSGAGSRPNSMPTLPKTDVVSAGIPKTHAVSESVAA